MTSGRGSLWIAGAGAALALATLPAMWWNERRAVTTARSLEEGGRAVVSVPAGEVDPANEGRLVHVTGKADTEERLADTAFGVSAVAVRLERVTEMYQWEEIEETETRDKPDGGQETVRTYSYHKTWSASLIPSKAFSSVSGHANPPGPMPFPSTEFLAGTVRLGAFELSSPLVRRVPGHAPLPIAEAAAAPPGSGMRLVPGGFYRGRDPQSPAIGDVRVSFRVIPPQVVSIVGRQVGRGLGPYATRAGDTLLMLEGGERTADAMFRSARSANRVLTWIIRGAAFFLASLGLFFALALGADLVSGVPVLGTLARAGALVLSLASATVLSLATVGAAWLFYRPVLAAVVLGLAAATVLLVHRRGRRQAAAEPRSV